MHNLLSDLKLAFRQLSKSPGFAATAVLMLAFGIGATTTIFSVVYGVLLRPLPFPHPDRLVVLGDHVSGTNWGLHDQGPVTPREVVTYARETTAFTGLGGYGMKTVELASGGEPAQVNAGRMTAGVFRALEVPPLMGRVFTAEEDAQKAPVAVLSYGTWKKRFNGNPQVVGSKILVDRQPYQVIGVMPRRFEFPVAAGRENRMDLWIPMSFTAIELSPDSYADWDFSMVGRLKPGVSIAQAQADAERVAGEINRTFPAQFANFRVNATLYPLDQITVEHTRPLLRMLLLAVTVVLLIACANLAGLLLVRAIRRQREIAVRLALGASGNALLRQAVLESTSLSVAGGLLGIGLAGLALALGKSFLPTTLPRMNDITLNWTVVIFALLLAVLTGLLCGLAPAFAALRTNVNASLKEGGRTGSTGSSQGRLRSMLVIAEIGVALILLTASGLLLRSFEKMDAVDLGFRPENVTTGGYSLPEKQYANQTLVDTFNRELLRRVRRLPGAEAVGWTSLLPATGSYGLEAFIADGYVDPRGSGHNVAAPVLVIGDYFRAMGIPLLRGRYFTDADNANGQLVVIVNHELAQRYWPGQDPIRKRMRLGTEAMNTPWMTVVGEIADAKLGAPDIDAREQYYEPLAQLEKDYGRYALANPRDGASGFIALRSALPPERMENALRTAARGLDPQLPLTDVRTMEDVVSTSEGPRRFNTMIISSFALAAMLLSVLGIYSVIAFSVASRVEEMAIRMALGARPAGIVRLVLRAGLKLALAGCVLGLAGAAAASGLLRSFLFGVSPFDPVVMAAAAALVFVLALLASALPARRAARVDPMKALRGM
jgi:putative ABC transport system permease protein